MRTTIPVKSKEYNKCDRKYRFPRELIYRSVRLTGSQQIHYSVTIFKIQSFAQLLNVNYGIR